MNWILVSCILIVSSTGLYLTLRSIERYKTPLKIKSLAMFASPLLPFLFYNMYSGISLRLPIGDIVILFFSAVFLSWFANMASLKALENAPNPGYPLIIGKSYVIYTTLFSVFFLQAEFSLYKILLIVGIIFFSSLIVLEKKSLTKSNISSWLIPTIYTFFAWGNLALVLTYLSQKGIPASLMNLYLLGFVTLFLVGEILLKKRKYTPQSKYEVIHLVLIAVFFIVFQQSMVYGYLVAPNPGYINAANAGSIGLVTLLSAVFFGDSIDNKKMIGVGGIIVCLILLFF